MSVEERCVVPSPPESPMRVLTLLFALFAILLATLAIPESGLAQSGGARRAGSSAPRVQAAARLQAGTVLFQEGNFDGAIAEFEASYALDPIALTRLNIGQCYRQLERYDEAIAEYRRYLAEATDVSRERREQVEVTIRDLVGLVATITLQVEPAGAAIRVDGRDVGAAPLSAPLRLGAGRRVVEVTADGYRTVRQDLLVAGGEVRTVEIQLPAANTGTVHVISTPEGAVVRIDGEEVGPTPLQRVLQSGGHVIEAQSEGFRLYRQSLTLAPLQDLHLQLQLELDTGPGVTGEWWFWTVVGAGAVGLVVGAVFLGIWLNPPQPDCGILPECATATLGP